MVIPLLGSFLIIAVVTHYAVDIFGHAASALIRYAMTDPDWGMVIIVRNSAYGLIAGVSLLPLFVIALVRFGSLSFLSFAGVVAAAIISVVVAGNMISIALPFAKTIPIDFTQGEPLLNQLVPLAVWALPLAIHHSFSPFGSLGFLIAVAIFLAFLCISYRFTVSRIGAALSQDIYEILARMWHRSLARG